MDTAARLKDISLRIKQLERNKQQVSNDAAVEESNLKQAYAKLRELGVANPEELTSKELQAMAEKAEGELAEHLQELLAKVEEAERLVEKYHELKD